MRTQTIATLLMFAAAPCIAWLSLAQPPAPSPAPNAPPPVTQRTHKMQNRFATEDAGEQKFRQNCSRCHNAPQDLSPRIAGTVALHMRVRASLSAQDERDILRFLAP